MKKYITHIVLAIVALMAFGTPVKAQLQLVEGSFRQTSNTDQANPSDWGDLDAQLLSREDRTDENGVKNALIKLKVEKISAEDMLQLQFVVDQGVFVKRTQVGKTPGEIWLLVTGITTSFYVNHPIFGNSNVMTLDLNGLCVYQLTLTNNETTTLTVLSEPVGAHIYLDGNYVGQAGDAGLDIPKVTFGTHHLSANLDDVSDELEIEVSEGSPRSYKLEVYKTRHFTFNSDPSGADLYIDGELVGKTPMTIPLKLKYHKVEARLNGEYDIMEAMFDEQRPNTINLSVVKHKMVQVAAMQSGRDISATVHIDGNVVGRTPHTADLEYGQHMLQVSYGSKVKDKRITVDDASDTYYRFKFKAGNSFTWPWEKEYRVRPVGLSVAYVQKAWVVSAEDENGISQNVNVDFMDEDKFMHGIQAGLRIQPQFGVGFGLSTGIFYEYYWDKSSDMYDDYGTYYAKYVEHDFYVPLCLEYRLVLAKNFSLFVNAGISMDIGLVSKINYFDEGDTDPYASEDNLYDAYDIAPRRFNLSYEFGGGLQIGGLQLAFNTSRAMLSKKSEQGGMSVKINKPMMVSLAYVFGGD